MATATKDETLLSTLDTMDQAALEAEVRHHNALYWDNHSPEIADETYDKLVEALRALAPTSPVLDELGESVPSGPERRFAAVTHSKPMLSLEKCYDDETLAKWRAKVPGRVLAMPKYDGVACALRYNKAGTLVLAATRGDGKVGDDITKNAARIATIPAQVDPALIADIWDDAADAIEVRGEVYMTLSRFNEAYAADFANPRNLTAGALKQKDPDASAAYKLTFAPYSIDGVTLPTEAARFALLERMGFAHTPIKWIEADDDGAWAYREYGEERPDLDYEIDGVVLRTDDIAQQKAMGLTSHHPRYALAYKFQGEAAQTTLLDVEWSAGRTGVLTPVALVKPVFVSGATVSRASLHNWGYVQKLGLRQGGLVTLVRRGGVIPKVERMLSAPDDAPLIAPPAVYPEGSDAATRVDGDFVYIDDPSGAIDVVIARVSHFCKAMDLLGFGPKILRALVEKGLVSTSADLFALDINQLCTLDRMGATLAARLVSEVNARRRLPLPVFLTALGIDDIGPSVAETLVEHHPSLDALKAQTVESLSEIHGIGPRIAESLVQGLTARAHEIDALLAVITLVVPEKRVVEDSDHVLANKAVVFTGKMALMDRKTAQKRVRDVGGTTPSSVTSTTDYVVIGDDGSPLLGEGKVSTKHKKANALVAKGSALQIITETAFVAMLE